MKLKSLLFILSICMIGFTSMASTPLTEREPKAKFTEAFEVKVNFVNVETFDFIQVEQAKTIVGNLFIYEPSKALEFTSTLVSPSDDVGWCKTKVNFNEVNKLPKRIPIDPNNKSGVIRIRSDS